MNSTRIHCSQLTCQQLRTEQKKKKKKTNKQTNKKKREKTRETRNAAVDVESKHILNLYLAI